MRKKRTCLMFIICVIIICAAAYYFRPIKMNKIMEADNGSTMQIIHFQGTVDFSNPGFKSKNYMLDISSNEYKSLCDLFTKYYYHSSISTLTKDTSFKNMDDMIVYKTSNHTVMLTDNSKITIDGIPYKMGYVGNSKSRALIKEFLKILENEYNP